MSFTLTDVFNKKCIIAPSFISVSDVLHLEDSVRTMEKSGIDIIHMDILDGHFSPSMPMGFDVLRAVRKITNLPFDVHLMTEGNDYYVDELLDIGVQQILFHIETEKHVDHMINRIHEAGVRAGVALKPATPISVLDYVLDKCDGVLLMLMNPGFADSKSEGQVPYAARKVKDLSSLIKSRGLNTKVVLDGRISRQNIADFGPNGDADIFVCGSTCLNKMDLGNSINELQQFRQGLLEDK